MTMAAQQEQQQQQQQSTERVAVTAAGGWVENEAGESLWFLRGGKWDLPKGRLEAGEAVADCAVREVKEECGLTEVERGAKLVETVHEYVQQGKRFVKTTHWYRMKVKGRPAITPQVSEGIERVAWLSSDEWQQQCLGSTYPSVLRVIDSVRSSADSTKDTTTTTDHAAGNGNGNSNGTELRQGPETHERHAGQNQGRQQQRHEEREDEQEWRIGVPGSTTKATTATTTNGALSNGNGDVDSHVQSSTAAATAADSETVPNESREGSTRMDDEDDDDDDEDEDEDDLIGPRMPAGAQRQDALSDEAVAELQASLVPCPVKLFRQINEAWEEQEEGVISLDLSDNLHLVIKAKDSDETMLDSRLTLSARACELKRGFIIIVLGQDDVVAISFNNDDNCTAYASAISNFLEVDATVEEDMFDSDAMLVEPVELPPPSVKDLPAYDEFLKEVLDLRQQSMDTQSMEQRRDALMKLKGFGHHMHEHVDTFFDTFEACDDLEDEQSLRIIYNMSLAMMLSCMPELFEALTSTSERLDAFVGTFEVPPNGDVQRHRDHLHNDTRFQEIEPMNDEELRFTIRKLYYINYIKDVILAGVIDDQLPFVLDSHAIFASGSVLERLVKMPEYLNSILTVAEGQSHERTHKQAMFLLEVFTMCGNQKSVEQPLVYDALAQSGLYNVINVCMRSESREVRHNAVCAVCKALETNYGTIRSIIQQNKWSLPAVLIEAYCKETSIATLAMLSHALEMLYDVETFMDAEATKSSLLNMLYTSDVLFRRLVSLFTMPVEEMRTQHGREKLVILLQLIGHWLPTHTYHIKTFATRNNLLDNTSKVMKAKDKLLTLAFARLLSNVVQTENNIFYRKLIAGNLMKPVMEEFAKVKDRYNMLTSTVLSIIEFTATKNLPSMRDYLVKNFRSLLESIQQHPCGRNLVLRYEQRFNPSEADALANGTASASVEAAAAALRNRFRKDGSMTEEEENYFSEDSIDADDQERQEDRPTIIMPNKTKPPPTHKKPLVSYDDNDDAGDDDEDDDTLMFRPRVLKKPKFTFAIGSKASGSGSTAS